MVILLKLVAIGDGEWSYSTLAEDLFISMSETHAGIKRAKNARLVDTRGVKSRKPSGVIPRKTAFEEFLVHGVKYAFPPDRGEITRGMPTGYAASFFADRISLSEELAPVWPEPTGTVRGYSFSPLYVSVPKAASRDQRLYELLALLDAIRDGRARERDMAVKDIKSRLDQGWSTGKI